MIYIIKYKDKIILLNPAKFGGQTLSNCKVKNITANSASTSENEFKKEFEITFETRDKIDTIQLSGHGAVKATVSV